MEYEDFELQIGPLSHEGLHVRVLRSPAGECEELIRLPSFSWDTELLLGALRHLKAEASGLPSSPAEIGSDLFQSVFAGQIGSLFHRSLGRIEVPLRGLRIRLRINPRDRTLAPLLGLPWELLYRKDTEEFLALNQGTPIVRSLDVPRPAAVRPYQPPLRILVVLARDPEGSPLSFEEELKALRRALDRNPAIRLKILEDPDTRTIRNVLDREAFHILHYMGHGAFETERGEGSLLFSGPEGRLPVTGRHLASKVRDLDALRLVVLNACETAVADGEAAQGPFAGVAAALVLGGVPAVVAMQSAIRDTHAVAFTAAFYDQLSTGMPVEDAVTEGRQAIHSLEPDKALWAIPVLFQRAVADGIFTFLDRPKSRATAPPPATSSSWVKIRQLLLTSVIALVLLGFVILNAVGRLDLVDLGQLGAGMAIRSSGTSEKVRSTGADLVTRSSSLQSSPVRPPAQPSASPAPAPSSLSSYAGPPIWAVAINVEGSTLQFEIGKSIPKTFVPALRKEVQALARSAGLLTVLDGRSIRIEDFGRWYQAIVRDGGLMISCQLDVTCGVRGGSTSINLGRVSGIGMGVDTHVACEEAAQNLAKSVTQRLAYRFDLQFDSQ